MHNHRHKPDVIAEAASLVPEIAAKAPDIERLRRLPPDFALRLAEKGLFRMGLPRELGGIEADPKTFLNVLEILGKADASTAWNVMVAATSALLAAYLPREAAAQIFRDPLVMSGGALAPTARAVRDGDGYRLTGRWAFGSGTENCQWLLGSAVIVPPGGLADARSPIRTFFFPASSATFEDTWHVLGLCGSGSVHFAVNDITVPDSFTCSLETDRVWASGPLYAVPIFGFMALAIGAVMLGNAAAAIDDLIALTQMKVPVGGVRTLAERRDVQSDLAVAIGTLRAARALIFDVIEEAWTIARAGAAPGSTLRAHMRIAATKATHDAADITRSMYSLAGGTGLYQSSVIQRRFRDAHAATQHRMVGPWVREVAGAVLLGRSPPISQF